MTDTSNKKWATDGMTLWIEGWLWLFGVIDQFNDKLPTAIPLQ